MIYYTQGVRNPDVVLADEPLIDWLAERHAQAQIVPYEDVQSHKRSTQAFAFFCSGFYDSIADTILTPPFAARASNKPHIYPVRDYVVIDFDGFTDRAVADTLPDLAEELFGDYGYAVFPTISYPTKPRYRLVVMVDTWLDPNSYPAALRHITQLIGLDHGDPDNEKLAHLMNAPDYSSTEGRDNAVFHPSAGRYPIADIVRDIPKPEPPAQAPTQAQNTPAEPSKQSGDTQTTPLDLTMLEEALKDYVASPDTAVHLSVYENFWRFAESVAQATRNGTIPRDFADTIMVAVADGNADWEKDNIRELEAQINKLDRNPKNAELVPPITTYLPVTAHSGEAKNLAELFDALLPADFEPDPQMAVSEVALKIHRFFDFALLPHKTLDDADKVAIYNPLTGAWEHDKNAFIAMMSVIKPGISKTQITTVLTHWGAIANRKDAYIRPYNGTQFLLFKNGLLDIDSMQLHNFSEPIVRNLQFTRRHKIHMDWNPKPVLKIFPGGSRDGSDWDIQKFIDAYGHQDPEIVEYFLFGLSLGLFAGHNTSVHFDIQGPSRLGKTTLAGIFENLFDGRIAITTYSQLNQQFPLTSYDMDTAVIWIKECNINAPPLNDEFGTPFYDGMADNQVRLPVKHAGDLVIEHPPQMYIDGTQFIQASEIHTGPAGRTLAYKLPNVTEDEKEAFYASDIHSKFNDEEVMQYLVYHMIQAFKAIVPPARLHNFKMNLGMAKDLQLIPSIARQWRQEFVNADTNIKLWFDEQVKDFLIFDRPLHIHVLYEIYRDSVIEKSGSDKYAQKHERFGKNIHAIFDEYGYTVEELGSTGGKRASSNAKKRYLMKDREKVGIDWAAFNESYLIPRPLQQDGGMPNLFGKKTTGWFKLHPPQP